MTDFGFGSLVGKYEEYFGRRVTRVLLIIVGLAVVALAFGVIWQWLISPLLAFFNTPVWGRSLISLVWTASGIGVGVVVGIAVTSAVLELQKWRKINSTVAEAKRILRDTEGLADRASEEVRRELKAAEIEIREGYAEVRAETADLLDAVIESARNSIEGVDEGDRAQLDAQLLALKRKVGTFRDPRTS